ncbi:MAG: hypothetical protein SGPRY_014306, partial [Prymnesium sp.]
MPPVASDLDPAVHLAHAAFRSTASQQLKRLQAEGIEGEVASHLLMDELVQHRSSHSASAASSSQLQHVVERTGFSREQASKALLLHQEITCLRGEGHSTAGVIEQLHGRLRKFGQLSRTSWDENGETTSHRRLHGGPLPKKHKLNEEAAIATFTTSGECLPHLSNMGHPTEKSDKRHRDDSRYREDPSPFAPIKKLKLRA